MAYMAGKNNDITYQLTLTFLKGTGRARGWVRTWR